ncbi:CAP domain-containing protein [Radiobacillus kanasensis]|uniref:CAP domain-containing protein n=1 Tax=Radiobacillus kanasensis TaxID=2844358 RepID=UPI001E60B8BB|nr:CAP domain-containing protein [Radiobacillus kanasensis]UFU00238.1 CAP domain-containing protein [Radiobacillus kanasensis]
MDRFRKGMVAVFAVLLTFFLATNPVAASNQDTKEVSNDSDQLNIDQLFSWFEVFDFEKLLEWYRAEQQGQTEQQSEETPQEETKVEEPTEENTSGQEESTSVKEGQTEEEKPASSEVHAFEQEVVELTNKERKNQGLKPLELSEEVSKVARAKSQDMVDKNYFSHQSPTYGSPFNMMNEFEINYRTAGENIAKGQRTPAEVVKAWMNSAGHRANILNAEFTHIGVGFVEANGTTYWTQMFIGQ